MEEPADRLKKKRIARNFESARAFADYAGIPYSTYAGHENGSRGVTRKAAARYAKLFRTTAGYILTDDETATKESEIPVDIRIDPTIRVRCSVGAGAKVEFFDEDDIDYEEIPARRGLGVMVKGDSQSPRYEDGELIEVDQDAKTGPEDGLFKECLVKLADNRFLIKEVVRGRAPGKFTLISHNAPAIEDVEIEWVIPFNRRIIIVR